MAGDSRDDEVLAHIASISSRTPDDDAQLADALNLRSWPGGGDRSEPGALEWLRRWRPNGPAPMSPLCGCRSGRCLLCN
jgi:hypothetical protein